MLIRPLDGAAILLAERSAGERREARGVRCGQRLRRTIALVTGDSGVARWNVFGERLLYDNRWVRLVQVDVEPPGGERFWHHVVRLQTVSTAIVIDDQDRVLLLRRHRFVTDSFGWELPGGIVDAGEGAATAAVRETQEETGWRPTGTARRLVAFEPMPGMVETPHQVFLFEGAEFVGEPTEADEVGTVAWLPIADIPKLIQDGEVAGSGSLVGLLYLLALGRSQD